MCDPFTIGSIILTGASVAANSMGASEVQNAREQDQQAERMRQAQFDKQADAINLTSRNRYQDFSGKQADRGGQLGDLLGQNQVPTTPSTDLMPQSNSNIVNTETAKQTGQAKTYTTGQSNALGQLRAFGDLLGEDSRLQGRDAQSVAQIGDFKKGSAAVLQDELTADNSAGSGMGMLGDILGGIGGLVGKGASGPAGGLSSLFKSSGVVSGAPNMALSLASPTNTIYGSGVLRNTGALY